MADLSTYKGLELPKSPERYNIQVFNKNAMVIDSELHKLDIKNESQDNLLATKESLNSEISRATARENDIVSNLNSEISRAKSSENQLTESLNDEINRATTAETNISTNLLNHTSSESNPHNVSKSQIGLGNVDNTSDANKPVSTAQQNALDLKADIDSPILTGVPKAPTASVENNTSQIATTAFVQTTISNHNISESAHNDIRILITELTTRLNTLADSDDTTLDQLSEIVAYIKNNKELIDCITTSKVNVSDIIDDLTSADPEKPLSSKQGTVLKGLITDLVAIVDDKVDKISGKGLSTNDFTNEDKNKLSGVASGANANVQSDWNVTTVTSDAYIKNKPASLPADGGIAQTISETLPISKGGTGKTTAKDAANILINGLTEGTSIPQDDDYYISQYPGGGNTRKTYHRRPMSALLQYIKSKLSTVAVSGSYNDLVDKPTIPTATSQLVNDSGFKTTDTVYTHPTGSGHKHIPPGGSNGQILVWAEDGTAVWGENQSSSSGIIYLDTEPTTLTDGMTWIGNDVIIELDPTPPDPTPPTPTPIPTPEEDSAVLDPVG